MRGNKNKATLILGAVSVGFFMSYPFQHTFLGGLLTGGFGAAMIGGLADWFAVSALFRHPLGIPFRTAIIPRNREKIFQTLTYMVENQLLVKENIKARLHEYDLAGAVINIMVEHDGKNRIKRMLYSFIRDMLGQVNSQELGRTLDDVIKDSVQKAPITLHILAGAEWLIKNGYDDKVIKFVLKQLVLLVEHKQIKALLAEWFIVARQRYERGMNRRKLFNQLLDLSADQVAGMVQKALIESLHDMNDDQHELRKKWRAWFHRWLIAKQTDVIFQEKSDKWLQECIIQIDFAQYSSKYIADFCDVALGDNRKMIKWLDKFMILSDKIAVDFVNNEDERGKLNASMQNIISNGLDMYHDEIGKMVMDSLNKFTNEMLVAFIEDKVGNDLQMIRINGSVVGGLVGLGLYLITFCLNLF